ncbi:CDK-activating kinase assembly factor MAT1-domain-containing protein [Macrophomina phaseolina]|uniref:RNA polymerase II transcription factor B subunit 3 n=1 Tax=Macrophomina phaseolina TaxID=35725 RepID=A0ABQ8FSW3_9PEZI|nr:CDK-activating kinase assembly factor MAT1-domain-containing protein [Macrophomina phaseolina]
MSRAARRESGPQAAKGAQAVEDAGEQLHQRLQAALQLDAGESANQRLAVPDICPVCKSSRYLNPNMRFLINPECYHQMCESCVDRIYSHGPAPCRIVGCGKTLRKNRFRKKTFEDIQVEREVDIRRRVAAVFNRREDEFETLDDYNNYLNDVEDITYDLVNRINVEQAEARLRKYAEANQASIKENDALAQQEASAWEAHQAAEKEQAKIRREAALREEQQLERERLEGRRDVINQLASGRGDASKIAQVHLKRAGQTRPAASAARIPAGAAAPAPSNGAASGGFQIKGLKKKVVEVDKPFDPFGGDTETRQYAVIQDRYDWNWLDDYYAKPAFAAGGCDIKEYYSHALCDAFSGFGIFVQDEVARINTASAPPLATQAAVVAGASGKGDVSMDDVF